MRYWKLAIIGGSSLLLGVLLGNVDRFITLCSKSSPAVEVPVEATPVQEPVAPQKPPKTEAPKSLEEQLADLHLMRVVVQDHEVRVYFSKRNAWLQNCNKKTFLVEPAVENFDLSTNWDGSVSLTGLFKGKTDYTLTVKSGVRTYDTLLKKDATTTFRMEEDVLLRPDLSILTYGTYLPLQTATLPYETINVDEVRFTLSRAYDNNLVPFGMRTWSAERLMTTVATQGLELKDVPRNLKRVHTLDVGALAKQRPGFYALSANYRANDQWHSEERVFLLTDLGVTYAYDAKGAFIVAVTSLSQGTPVTDATVEVVSEKHQILFRGTTDTTGIARLTLVPDAPYTTEDPVALLVRAGNDITYLNFSEHSPLERGLTYISLEMNQLESRAMAWADRGAVRPGEPIRLHAMVRDATLKAMSALPVTFTLFDPRGQEVLKQALTTDAEGIVFTDYVVPADSTSGSFTATLTLDDKELCTTQFYVADFVPDRIKVSVAFEGTDTLVADAQTYFDTEVHDATGTLTLTATPRRTVDQWKGWTVGEADAERTKNIFSRSVTKPKGAKIKETYTLGQVSTPLTLRAQISLAEPGGRTVTGSTTDLRFTEPGYIGLRHEDDTLQMALLTPEGLTCDPMPVTLKLDHHEWDYVVVREGNAYRYQWKETVTPVTLEQSEWTLTQGTPITLPMSEKTAGRYVLQVTNAKGMRSELEFWHDAGEAGERSEDPSVLTFKTNKSTYKPGEIADLTFMVPSEGRLLITEGCKQIDTMSAFDVPAGETGLSIAIPSTLSQKTWYVGVTFIAKDVQNKGRRFGIAKLPVDLTPNHGLQVAVETTPIARPKSTTDIKVKLSTPTGQPLAGEVVLFAVDEGILALTQYKTPNPLADLTASTRSGINIGDSFGALYPHLKINKDGRIGGGKDEIRMEAAPNMLMSKRAQRKVGPEGVLDYADVIRVVLPPQQVPASGELTVALPVPNHQGALRIMAVAASGNRVGSGERALIVRPEATLLLSTVRYACPGDQADTTMTLTNHDLPEGSYTITLKGETSHDEQTPSLAPQAHFAKSVMLPAESRTATLTYGDRVIMTEELPVLVRPAIPTVKATTFALLPAGEALPEGAVKVESFKDVERVVLDWLTAYPYICTEQLAARALPLTATTSPEEAAFVADVCRQLLARQLAGGGFGMWPGSETIWNEGSLLASHLLLTANRNGHFALGDATRTRLHTYLQTCASDLTPRARPYAAFATWVLAMDGDSAILPTARNLLATNTTDSAAFLAATALVKSGYANEGAPILKSLLAAPDARTPIFESLMDITAQRALEVALATDCNLAKEITPSTLAKFFTGSRATTQQNLWTALALQALGNALPEGTLIKKTEMVSAVRPGQAITLKRSLRDAEGKVLTSLKHGDLAYVFIEIDSPRAIQHFALRDLLPGGLEFEDATLATRADKALPTWFKTIKDSFTFTTTYTQTLGSENRWFGSINGGRTKFIYPVRATTRGTFALPVLVCEDMYDPLLTGATGGEGTLTIE